VDEESPSWYSAQKGRLLSLPANVRIGWKGLAVKNSLAYYV